MERQCGAKRSRGRLAGDLLADSMAELSAVQGMNGRFSGCFNRATDSDGIYPSGDFMELSGGEPIDAFCDRLEVMIG